MFRRNSLIGVAACAALAMTTVSRADVNASDSRNTGGFNSNGLFYMDDTTQPAITEATPAVPPPAPAGSPPPVTPLNRLFANIPGFADTGIKFTGYVEGSWTYSAHPPAGNILSDREFDTKTESIQFDAVELQSYRLVDYTKPFDIGYTVEAMYGWDAAYLHANGLSIYGPGNTASRIPGGGTTATIHPKTQFDLVQANFTVSFDVGNGLGFMGGKFNKLMGEENIDGPTNRLFSHSYIFMEEPLTHTGLLGMYNLTKPSATEVNSSIAGGISRGWDQATNDDNGSIDFLGQYKISLPNRYELAISAITGDEFPSGTQNGWRTTIDLNGRYNISDEFKLGVNAMYSWEAQASNGGIGGGTAQWYGAAAYLNYQPNEYLSFNGRLEWFDDQNGAAPIQLSSSPANIRTGNQFYEVTVGLTYHPFANNKYLSGLAIRPEARWDYSDHAAFNGGAQHDQWTGTIEAYYAF